ncbi:MAG TPA: Gfo/Idh/MocA family oxidoreductase [Puia sp.]|nr:Gfo/Idh/MocA family oxidoreductase [Puia sp.]
MGDIPSGHSRRKFIDKVTKGIIAGSLAPGILKRENDNSNIQLLQRSEQYSANDQVQVALIGAGGMGNADVGTCHTVAGVKIIAVCDLYNGRLDSFQNKYGKDIFVTKDYKEILSRKDIDAVIIATPDHWHKDISVEAMNSGKAVYCEKPMVHDITEGPAVIDAQNKNKSVFQVGSQGMSSLGNEKAKQLYESGAIGQLNYAEGFWARNSPEGAWEYDIPVDASEKTVDWKRFLKNYPMRNFDAKRFFRWRCYRDYGTGVSGDLFVHLFSSLHFIVSSFGPEKIMATGGLRYWKDGREVPDILLGMFDYPQTEKHPAFNLSLRVNFVDGTAENTYLRLVGNEGSMIVEWDKVTLTKNKSYPPAADDPSIIKDKPDPFFYDRKQMIDPDAVVFKAEQGYKGAHFDHHYNWIHAIRGGRPVIENALFGYRAAAPALLCNDSYFAGKTMRWDPVKLALANQT